ncbi:hypothetical protein FACS1894122_07500 [Alphaproteobacteria bacterium]|nr:hypothetical protein FACS1894122_07500 [Alphaproteobacteria bacterium]
MRIILCCILCMLLIGCESEKVLQDDSFLVEEQMTEDMRKIKDIFISEFAEGMRIISDERLRAAKITYALYGKSNRRLNNELPFVSVISYRISEILNKMQKKLKASMNGLKLSYNQVLPLAKAIEEKVLDKIIADNIKLYTAHKARTREILEDIQAKEDAQPESFGESAEKISSNNVRAIKETMRYIIDNGKNEIVGAFNPTPMLLQLITDGTLKDSFLKKTTSPIKENDECCFLPCMSWPRGTGPKTDSDGTLIFDALRNAVKKNNIKNAAIERSRLEHFLYRTSGYLSWLAFHIHDMHVGVECGEELGYFYAFEKDLVPELVKKFPKLEDFEKQIDALSARLAYHVYWQVNIARFLYREWSHSYMSQMNELLENSSILAEKLHNLYKDEKIYDTEKRRKTFYECVSKIKCIREFASIGTKAFTVPSSPLSQKKIKAAYKNRFMKMRESYLRHM